MDFPVEWGVVTRGFDFCLADIHLKARQGIWI